MSENLLEIKGVGEKNVKLLNSLSIYKKEDLINYFARDYELFDKPKKIIDLEVGKVETVEAIVVSNPTFFSRGNIKITSCVLDDGSGRIRAYWFNFPFIKNSIVNGRKACFRGRVSHLKNGIALSQCKIYSKENYSKMEGVLSPIYPLTKGVTNNFIRKTISTLIEKKELTNYEEFLPQNILKERSLCTLSFAYEHIHFPKNFNEMLIARRRLVYNEFFIFILSILLNKNKTSEKGINGINIKKANLSKMKEGIGFSLTKGQEEILDSIIDELKKEKKINRLIEGDVGSGKTIIAIITAFIFAKNGYQTAFMVPTEVLANQHYKTILKIIEKCNENINIAILTGSTKQNERKKILSELENGTIDILIGTHALYSKDVIYKNLGLVIIDEQHRFGVMQRKAIEEKGKIVDVIAMSATPIPRTLAMIFYADMTLSCLKEKPIGRKKIKTCVINANEREKAYKAIKKEIDLGHQVYVICANIEKNDEEAGSFADFQNVIDYSKKLSDYFGKDTIVKTLHGKMDAKKKQSIMNEFEKGEINILVSTTVIEVGVDVPNATFIMVEDAGFFGLAELHQLRGRVGRGDSESYALFVDTQMTDKSRERLNILNNSHDGFYIAEEDLKLRGPGDIFGVRQSGLTPFKLGDLYTDIEIFKMASDDAKEYLKENDINKVLLEKIKDKMENGYVL